MDSEPANLEKNDDSDVSSDAIKRARKKLRKAIATVEQTELEKKRLKAFLIGAAVAWPLGLFFHWLWCIAIIVGCLFFFSVGSYLSFFHRRNAQADVDDIERQLQEFGAPSTDEAMA